MKHKSLTMLILALLAVSTAQGEVSAKKKVIEPVCDSLQLTIQAGDSLMQQYNTFEALRYYQQAFAMKDTLESRTKLADCYYQRGNYRQTADLLKLVPEDSLSHEAFRQLALSYQKQNETDAYIYWSGQLLERFPMDGEIVAGRTLAFTRVNQPEKGIVCGMKYCLRDTTNILVNRALADAWFMNRDFKAASKLYERLLQQGDSTFNTLYSAGMCYAQIDSLNQAYNCLLPAFQLSQMQHANCAYRLGVVSVDLHSYEEGLAYLNHALKLMLPDTTVMKAITLSQGEGYYLTKQYDKAVEAWKLHLTYNPSSIATYYNIASAYYYLLSDVPQAKSYLEQFLQAARREQNPNAKLTEMINKADELLYTINALKTRRQGR
jgi:tetratricopeptide (TPR) repeat protein